MDNEITEKIDNFLQTLSEIPSKAITEKDKIMSVIKKKKSEFKKALKSGHTRKGIISKLNDELGINISLRDFSKIIGTKKRKSIAKSKDGISTKK